jgi:cell division septation protein DedD
VVKDLKGHLEKGEKKAESSVWLVLVVSHMVIFVVGIVLGHWMGGRLLTESPTEKAPSSQMEIRGSIPEAERPETTDDASPEQRQTVVGELPDQVKEPEFTFYESLKRDNQTTERIPPTVGKMERSKPSSTPAAEVGEQQASRNVTGKKGYYVQVASFRDEERAEMLAAELRGKGYTAQVVSGVVVGKGIWHRVRLGPFENKSEAHTRAQDVANKENFRPLIIMEKQ